MTSYQNYINENKTKLNSFCANYFAKYFDSDKLLITEEKFINLLGLISSAENDVAKFKRMFLFDYLSDISEKEELPEIIESGEESFEFDKMAKIIKIQGEYLKKVKKTISDAKENTINV